MILRKLGLPDPTELIYTYELTEMVTGCRLKPDKIQHQEGDVEINSHP